jgi:hypothetical protein
MSWGTGGIAQCVLNLGTRWSEWSASCSGCFTHRGMSPRYPLHMRLGGPQGQSGPLEMRNVTFPCYELNCNYFVVQFIPMTIPVELFWHSVIYLTTIKYKYEWNSHEECWYFSYNWYNPYLVIWKKWLIGIWCKDALLLSFATSVS